jgi:hypothetical protein
MGMGGQRHAPAALPLGKPRYPLYGGWVCPRTGLNGCGKSRGPPIFDPRTVHPVASRYTDCLIPAPNFVQWHSLCVVPHCGTVAFLAPKIMRWLEGFGYCVPLMQAACWSSFRTKCVRCGHLQWDRHYSVAHLSHHFLLSWLHGPYRYDLSQEEQLGMDFDKP